jgi:hypothetical protein
MTAYTCPLCGMVIRYGGLPTIILHQRVSHSGATPIEGITE